MKIGILTLYNSLDNYGQHLQLYALQQYLLKMNHQVFLIKCTCIDDYESSNKLNRLFKALVPYATRQKIKGKFQTTTNICKEAEDRRDFLEFEKNYINVYDLTYNSYFELRRNPPEADIYLVGSDQVWNFWNLDTNSIENVIRTFFLDFGSKNVKRISYAASWGRRTISDEEKKIISPLLKKFDAISVREKSGIDLCKSCGCENALQVCDPTLLLGADDYRKLTNAKSNSGVDSGNLVPYVLFYYIDNGGTYDKASVFRWASDKNLKVLYIAGTREQDEFEQIYATIPERLGLIDSAQYVITNSFHCSLFSLMFAKPFGVIKLNGDNAELNTRLESMFEMCGVKSRYCDDHDFSALDLEIEKISVSKKYTNFLTNMDFLMAD